MKLNLKFSSLLFFLNILVNPSLALTITGTQISDLESSTFLSDLLKWTKPGSAKYSVKCAGVDIFGFGLVPQQSISRNYTDLPPHESVTLILKVSFLDSWESPDYIGITVDEEFHRCSFDFTNFISTAICGFTPTDPGPVVFIISKNHNKSYLTLKFTAGQDQTFGDESFGVTSVTILFSSYAVTESFSISSRNNMLDVNNSIITNVSYLSTGCHSTCGTCKGPLETDCLTCANISMYFTGTNCYNCKSECYTCINETTCLPFTACTPHCSTCSNISACGVCESPFVLNGTTCDCPVGSVLNSLDVCETVFYFPVSYDFNTDANGILFTASPSSDELAAYPDRNYTWLISSNSSNTTNIQILRNYLVTVTNLSILIEYEDLDGAASYTISCSYINAIDANVTNSTTISLLFLAPKFSQSSNQLSVERIRTISIPSDFILTSIPILTYSYQNTWTIISGSVSSFTGSLTSFDIPMCTLSQNTSYQISTLVWFTKIPSLSNTKTFSFSTPLDKIYLEVNYLNRQHPFTQPMVLQALLYFDGNCPDMTSQGFSFSWSCIKTVDNINYSPCLDGSSIFNISSTKDTLVIPISYFYKGLNLKIGVTARRNTNVLNTSGLLEVFGEKTIIIAITCLVPPCQRYNPDADMYLKIVIQNNPGIEIKFEWTVNSSVPTTSFNGYLRVEANDGSALGQNNLVISAKVLNLGYNGGSKLELPVNYSPKNGTLRVTPSFGTALSTQFFINASGWMDPDLPLSYEFFFTSLNTTISLSSMTYSSILYSFLPGGEPYKIVVVSVNFMDIYNAISLSTYDVNVSVAKKSVSETYTELNNFLNNLDPENNPTTSIANAAIASSYAAALENQILELRENIISCTSCADTDKECLYGTCSCRDKSNATVDCSISKDDFDKLVDTKSKVMEIMKSSFENLNSSGLITNSTVSSMLSTLKVLSTNTDFLVDNSLTQIQNILDNSIKFTDSKTNFTLFQHTEAVELVNNLIDYKSAQDCNCSSATCQALENRTKEYMEKLANKSLQNFVPGQESYDYLSIYFDITTVRSSVCDLSSLTLQSSSDAPSITLQPKNPSSLNCSQIVDVQMFNFKNNTFGCSNVGFKNTLMISIKDTSTGKSLDDLFKANVKMPNGLPCPEGCKNLQSYCDCELSLFDVSKQLDKIFRTSSLRDLQNFEALQDWIWYDSPIFWVNFALLGWLSGSYLLFARSKKVANYCIVEKILQEQDVSMTTGLIAIFLTSSNITSIFLLNKNSLPKNYKMLLYYLRLLFYATYSAIFSSSGATDSFLDLLTQLRLYIILLPLLTVTPINAIISKIITFGISRQFFALLLVSGCIVAMFVIAANKDATAQKPWLATFLLSFLQELIVLPTLVMIGEITLLRRRSAYLQKAKQSRLKEKIFGLIDPNSIIIYEKISRNKFKKVHPEKVLSVEDLKSNNPSSLELISIPKIDISPRNDLLPQVEGKFEKKTSRLTVTDLRKINVKRRISKSHILSDKDL